MFKYILNKFLILALILNASLVYSADRNKSLRRKNNDFVNKMLLDGARNRNLDVVKQAIASGADVNFRDPASGATPLDDSISKTNYDDSILNTNLEVIKFLLDNGADVNGPGHLGFIPLVRASQRNNKQSSITIIKMLLEKGANVNAFNGLNAFSFTPWNSLMMAASEGNTEAVITLLLAGADINIKNLEGKNAYELALERNHFGTAAVLQAWPEIKKFMEDEVAAQLDETGILLSDLNKIVAEYAVGYSDEESKENSEK